MRLRTPPGTKLVLVGINVDEVGDDADTAPSLEMLGCTGDDLAQ